MAKDLEDNWAVVAEALQTVLRREGYPKPYEALKELTRTNTHITKDSISAFIDTLNVNDSVKAELKLISPNIIWSTMTGLSKKRLDFSPEDSSRRKMPTASRRSM